MADEPVTRIKRTRQYAETDSEGECRGVDEIVADGLAHLEQMTDSGFFLGLGFMQVYLVSDTPIECYYLQNEQTIEKVEVVPPLDEIAVYEETAQEWEDGHHSEDAELSGIVAAYYRRRVEMLREANGNDK